MDSQYEVLRETHQKIGGGVIDSATLEGVKRSLTEEHGEENRFRIERGVDQAAIFWTARDGGSDEFTGMCRQYFTGAPQDLDAIFERIETNFEVMYGYFTEMRVDLRRSLQLDWGDILPVDMAFGKFNPAAHLTEDFFRSGIAFMVLLNFPHYSLEEKTKLGPGWNRREWACARIGDTFTSRTPAAVNQEVTRVMTEADTYISRYNVYMGNLVDDANRRYFPKDMKLISHWGLRDELKARYNDPAGLLKQKMIHTVMQRIIAQEVPEAVIDDPDLVWNPFSNRVTRDGIEVDAGPEPDTRYRHFLEIFRVMEKLDRYHPYHPSHILRRFEVNREIPEALVEKTFTSFLSSDVVGKVAKLVKSRLGRGLEPFDIWYSGFRGNDGVPEEELDRIVSGKYRNLEAFEKDIGNILLTLGFPEETAALVAPLIRVDPARGSGHCVGASSRLFKSRLRTRVPAGGMNYKGFNIAMHELGHAVEQTLTMQKTDHYSLSGVPNTAFTEAFAFVFQDRDLDILGIRNENEETRHQKALDSFWCTFEITGVSLVDMMTWNWLYRHPDAGPAELRVAVTGFAKDVWNEYFAGVFGTRDQEILAVYSHMIDAALYLPDYPIGHLIQFQIEKHLEGRSLGSEMTRMCAAGDIIPELWMKNAVGSAISSEPILEAAREAAGHFS